MSVLSPTRYRLISGDSHLNEPPDLWTARVPEAMRDRVPRIESLEEGDAWIIEGVPHPINFGMNSCAGLLPQDAKGWVRFEDIRRGGWDSSVRIEEMDQDGVDAEALFPTPRLGQGVSANTDVALHLAMVRAYNDWLSEYVAYAPDRFAGLALLPNRGADLAVEEIERVAGRPGIRGVVMACYPNGTLTLSEDDDKVWAKLVEVGFPLNIHVSLSTSMPATLFGGRALNSSMRFNNATEAIVQIVVSGMLDRFEKLQIIIAEVDCGWVPYFKEQMDNIFRRVYVTQSLPLAYLPSEYVERQFHFTYMTDMYGIQNRHQVGVDRMLWSSDYPHVTADWPYSWKTIQASFVGVPAVERDMILTKNAERLYGFKPSATP